MPIYEYRCSQCFELTTVVAAIRELEKTVACAACGASATRIISSTAVHRSKASKLERLDPKYDKMVEREIRKTPTADPDYYLKRVKN